MARPGTRWTCCATGRTSGSGVLTREVEGLLESARSQAGFVARALETGEADPGDPEQVTALLFGAMAADPSIGAIVYFRADGQTFIAERTETLAKIRTPDFSNDEGGAGRAPLRQVEPEARLGAADLPARLRLVRPYHPRFPSTGTTDSTGFWRPCSGSGRCPNFSSI